MEKPISVDEPSLPGDFAVVKALLQDDISSIPAFDGLDRIERMQAIRRRGKAALPALLELARDKDKHTQATAITIIGWIGDPDAIPTLIDIALQPTTDRFDTGRYLAVFALANIGKSAEQTLIMLLDHDEHSIQQSAATGLGILRSKAAAPKLVQLLVQAAAPDKPSESTSHYIRILGTALGRIGDPDVIPVLEAASADGDSTSRYYLVQAINNIGGQQAADSLLRIHARSGSAGRADCLGFLSRMRDTRVVPLLRSALKSSDSRERYVAIRGYLYFDDPLAIRYIQPLLQDPDRYVSQTADQAVQQLQRNRDL